MDESVSKIATLFRKYYNGTATVSETDRLLKLIDTSKNDKALFELLEQAWETTQIDTAHFSNEKSQQILKQILQENASEHEVPTVAFPRYNWLKYAASILIVLGIALGTKLLLVNSQEEVGSTQKIDSQIVPGGNSAKLTLSDGTEIDLDSLSNGQLVQQDGVEISKTADGKLVYKVLATAETRSPTKLNTISTPRGGQYEVRLPDGSVAWLNASSTLRFPTQFASKERRVVIEGEVYFEIQKDQKRPFKVDFGKNEIEVLGTHFNVMYYPEEDKSETTLAEGSVLLKSGGKTNKLKPGQQAQVLNSGDITIKEVDIDKILAWKAGLFYFNDEGIQSVMGQVSRWYDIEVKYEGTPSSRQLNGKVLRSVSITELMDMLQYAGIKYKINGRVITIYN